MEHRSRATRLMHVARGDEAGEGYVNLPVRHASTYTYSTVAAYDRAIEATHVYGAEPYARMGTEPVIALERAISELEGGHAARATSSGLSAITLALLAVVEPGCHVLVPRSVYPTTRTFCDQYLAARLGIEVTYYDPRIGAGIAELLRPGTRAVYLESPGSYTFEVQDVPAIAGAVAGTGIVTIADNTWAGSLLCRPLALGADISVSSLSKYVCGHADAMLGIVVASEPCFEAVRRTARLLGQNPAPDAVFLALRGLRTLELRLERHGETALALAAHVSAWPNVREVFCPGLAGSPDHALWRRDGRGHAGLFSFVFEPEVPEEMAARFIDALRIFRLGSSWGGFESLIIPAAGEGFEAGHPARRGAFCRVHAGLEDARDLIADLDRAFAETFGAAAAAE